MKSAVDVIPSHHGHDCSPQCYCLKCQATPLSLQGDMRLAHPGLWEESFKDRSWKAADKVISKCASNSASTLRHHAHDVYAAHQKLLL